MKPGSREVLHRPYHIYDYLPPMYPEMEGTEDENMPSMSTSLDENKIEIKTEAPTGKNLKKKWFYIQFFVGLQFS